MQVAPFSIMALRSISRPLCTISRNHYMCRLINSATTFSAAEVRRGFLDFFRSNDHVIVPSSSVNPHHDTSLLFVNAGMNQFKNVLLGTEKPASPRVANSQKCIRAGGKHNDLDDVGLDGRHHTYFEMLGNWSFGDYFQQDACRYAYTLLTEVYRLPKERLLVTYFGGEPEVGLEPDFACREIWRSMGIKESHVIPLGMDENFWTMGVEGPCGPCTEIHYSETGDPANMLEIWNLVFMQFNRTRKGNLEPLKKKHVDTGMGLERIVAVLQGKSSNYDTDLFTPLLDRISELTGSPAYQSKFGDDDHQGLNTAYRILADHARMCTVAIADGMVPDESRARNVLRKIIRRAALMWSNKFRSDPVKWAELVHTVAISLGETYPEISVNESSVKGIVVQEIEKFKKNLTRGTLIFDKMYKKLENKTFLQAPQMFRLYSEHGVPEELIFNFIKSRNMGCDAKGFYLLLEEERQLTRADWLKKQQSLAA